MKDQIDNKFFFELRVKSMSNNLCLVKSTSNFVDKLHCTQTINSQ